MRPTLALEPDVRALVDDEVRRSGKTFEKVVNEALRRGLTRSHSRGRPVVLRVFQSRLRPGHDVRSLIAVADEMEDETVVGKAGR